MPVKYFGWLCQIFFEDQDKRRSCIGLVTCISEIYSYLRQGMICWMIFSKSKLVFIKDMNYSIISNSIMNNFFYNFTDIGWEWYWSIIISISFTILFVNRTFFPIFKISVSFLLVNVRFIRRLSGALRDFLNVLKIFFQMLKDPLLVLFFSVVM